MSKSKTKVINLEALDELVKEYLEKCDDKKKSQWFTTHREMSREVLQMFVKYLTFGTNP